MDEHEEIEVIFSAENRAPCFKGRTGSGCEILDLVLGILTVAQILILILGGVVVYYASRAYRKTKSGAMLFLAIGFGFVVIGAAAAGVLYNLDVDLEVALTVQATSQVIGFLAIVYSLTGTKD